MGTALLALMGMPAGLIDDSGCIVVSNGSLDDFLGEPARGKQAGHCLFPDDPVDFSLKAISSIGRELRLHRDRIDYWLRIDDVPGQSGLRLLRLVAISPLGDVTLDVMMDRLELGIWRHRLDTDQFVVSPEWKRMRGLSADAMVEEESAKAKDWMTYIHPADREPLQVYFDSQSAGREEQTSIQYRLKHSAGHYIWIMCRSNVVSRDTDGNPLEVVGLDTDITALKRDQTELMQLGSKLQLAIKGAGIGVWEFDAEAGQVTWDQRMLDIYGLTDGEYRRAENLWESYIHPDDRAETMAYSDHCLRNNLDFSRDYRVIRPDGEVRHVRSLARFVREAGDEGKLLGINIDVTDDYRQRAELEDTRARLEYDSRHDALTGLANRRRLDERADAVLSALAPGDRFAVMQIDVDNFKRINDTKGHAAGDQVLVHIANLLKTLVGDQGLVSRNGGDEFVVLLFPVHHEQQVEQLCQSILQQVKQPFILQSEAVELSVSIGVAISDGPPEAAANYFINADIALYDVKAAGRGTYRMFEPGMQLFSASEAFDYKRLADALSRGEIGYHLQPQFDARSRNLLGAEVLARWFCPQRGILHPAEFIPIAKKAGLLAEIDRSIFRQALALQSKWQEQGRPILPLSVNLSREWLSDRSLIQDIETVLKPYHRLTFELLETAFLDDADDELVQKLAVLRSFGIGLAIDDFGSGHASIVAMQTIEPDWVKIDRQLIAPILTRPHQAEILQTLIQLARLNRARTILEGVETDGQIAALGDVSCDGLQGFGLARPMPVDQLEELLTDWDGLNEEAVSPVHWLQSGA
ncbi:MAG: EAL domain-containing protein [Pseudomonadota bacterium]